jgi:hypothetical protein
MGLTRRKNMRKYRNKRKGGGGDNSNAPPSPRSLRRSSLLNLFTPSPDGSSSGGPVPPEPEHKVKRPFGYPARAPPLPHPLSREPTDNLLDFIRTYGSSNPQSREGSLGGNNNTKTILEIERTRRIIEELNNLKFEAKMQLRRLEKTLPEHYAYPPKTRRASFGYPDNSDDNNNPVNNWKALPS